MDNENSIHIIKQNNEIFSKRNSKRKLSGKNIKTILRLFPYLDDKDKAYKLMIDIDSIYYISVREYADKISQIIKFHIEDIGFDSKNAIVTDGTAGVGGNTISFARNFRYVYSIEIDKLRSTYLENNIDVYDLKNIGIINNNCLSIIPNIPDQDIVYLDPPWGGKKYKEFELLTLSISDITIENICNKFMDVEFMKKTPAMIVLKLPKNYDIVHFYKSIDRSKQIYYYDLKKMIILVIINKM
jgi:16S rRNA G966 N2-methylase RsmD